jgi:hypothetical protein
LAVLWIVAGVSGLQGQEGTPSCGLDPSRHPQTQIDEIRACALQLDAAGAFDCSIIGTCDTQWLDEETPEETPPVFNCVGALTPERRAHWNSQTDVGDWRNGGGRVTLKVEIQEGPGAEAGACTGYRQKSVRLPLGVSYVFVYSLGTQTQPNDKRPAHIIVVPADPTLQARPGEIDVCWHPEYGYLHSLARWRHQPEDARGWWTCADGACCST